MFSLSKLPSPLFVTAASRKLPSLGPVSSFSLPSFGRNPDSPTASSFRKRAEEIRKAENPMDPLGMVFNLGSTSMVKNMLFYEKVSNLFNSSKLLSQSSLSSGSLLSGTKSVLLFSQFFLSCSLGPSCCESQAAIPPSPPSPLLFDEPSEEPLKFYRSLETPFRPDSWLLRLLVGWLAMSLMIALWALALCTPFVLLRAITGGKWRLLSAILAVWIADLRDLLPSFPSLGRLWFECGGCWFEEKTPEVWFAQAPSSYPSERVMYTFLPHGMISLGIGTLWREMSLRAELEEGNEGRLSRVPVFCGSLFLKYLSPLFSGLLKLTGVEFKSVGRSELREMMKAGSPLTLVPGGFHEATISPFSFDVDRVFLKQRKGFVKYALREGYSIVPCIAFGEADTYRNLQGGWPWRLYLNSLPFQLPAVLPLGEPWSFLGLPLLPRRQASLTVVVGSPFPLPRIEQPTDEEVDRWHGRYMSHLKEEYDRVKVSLPTPLSLSSGEKGTDKPFAERTLEIW